MTQGTESPQGGKFVASEAASVGVVIERRPIASPWADHDWRPVAVLPGAPGVAAGSKLAEEGGRVLYFAGVIELRLHRSETESYRINLAGERHLYLCLRRGDGPNGLPVRIFAVTAAPDEAQAWSEGGDDIVAGVPMPAETEAWIADFVARFHVDKVKHKRQRTEVDPNRLGFGTRGPAPGAQRKP